MRWPPAARLLGALDREALDHVGRRAALVVAAARIAFRIFVGEDRALRFEHRAADDILRRDQLDLVLLAAKLGLDRAGYGRIGVEKTLSEEAQRLYVSQVGRSGHQSLSCKS